MQALREYINSLKGATEKENFASRCGTTLGYLRKAISANERIAESTCIAIERESAGKVRVELIRPDVDWAFLRGSTATPLRVTSRKRA